MLCCKPHSCKVQGATDSPQHWEQQHKLRREVLSKETSVCVAPLHHAIVKPEGLEFNTHTAIWKPLGLKWPEQTHSHSQTWRGNRGEDGCCFFKKKKKKKKKEKGNRRVWGRTYLYFTSFHQRTVKLLFGPLCIRTWFKCYKAKTLQAKESTSRR